MVDNRELLHGTLVGLQVGQSCRVRTPPEALEVTPTIDLFLVDPVEFGVEQIRAAATSQSPFAVMHHIDHNEIVVAHERDHGAIRAERRHGFKRRVSGQSLHPTTVERRAGEVVQIV